MFIYFHSLDNIVVINANKIVSIAYFEYEHEQRIRINLTNGYAIVAFDCEEDEDTIMTYFNEFIESDRKTMHATVKSVTLEY